MTDFSFCSPSRGPTSTMFTTSESFLTAVWSCRNASLCFDSLETWERVARASMQAKREWEQDCSRGNSWCISHFSSQIGQTRLCRHPLWSVQSRKKFNRRTYQPALSHGARRQTAAVNGFTARAAAYTSLALRCEPRRKQQHSNGPAASGSHLSEIPTRASLRLHLTEPRLLSSTLPSCGSELTACSLAGRRTCHPRQVLSDPLTQIPTPQK